MRWTKGDEKHFVEIQVCPRCLGSKVSRLNASSGDMTGALTILPPKFVCSECGWIGRLVIFRNVDVSLVDFHGIKEDQEKESR